MSCLLTCIALSGLGSCPVSALGQAAAPGAPEPCGALAGAELELPARPGARWPSLTSGADGRLYAAWIEASESGPGNAGGDSVLAVARLDGERWQRLSDAAAGPGWFVNWADMPALAALEDGSLAASFLVRNGESAYAYEVRLVLSRDGGVSWSEPFRLHEDPHAAEHGFVSLEPLGGRFAAVWLDGRATPSSGPMGLWARTVGRDGSLGRELCLDERVCDCCQTAAAAVGDALAVAYRDRGPDEVRDVSWLALGPGAWDGAGPMEARSLAHDGWKIPGCPVNGPALAAREGELAAAWFTLGADERPRVLVRRLGLAAAEPGSAPAVVSDADPLGRVDLAFDAAGALWVTWLERRGEQGEWMAARFPAALRAAEAPSERTALARVGSIGRDTGFGRLACAGGALYFAWTDTDPAGGFAVRVLRLATPPAAAQTPDRRR